MTPECHCTCDRLATYAPTGSPHPVVAAIPPGGVGTALVATAGTPGDGEDRSITKPGSLARSIADFIERVREEGIAHVIEVAVDLGVKKAAEEPFELLIKVAAGVEGFVASFAVVKAFKFWLQNGAFSQVNSELERQRRAADAARRARDTAGRQEDQAGQAAVDRAGRLRSAGRAGYRRWLQRVGHNQPSFLDARAKARSGLLQLGVSPADLDDIERDVGLPSLPRDEPCR